MKRPSFERERLNILQKMTNSLTNVINKFENKHPPYFGKLDHFKAKKLFTLLKRCSLHTTCDSIYVENCLKHLP